MRVFVINKNGKPLMPCEPVIARLLLKQGKANVTKRKPFTIQLLYNTTEYKQQINLGIDSGYQHIGFSAITRKNELISGEVNLDNWMPKRLQDKALYRRNRRSRLRYRKPKFNNRKREGGWLPPSIQRRFDTHITLINKLKNILPITKITVEVGSFDIQKLQNPDIQSVEYKRGEMYGYTNLKYYLLSRENGICQLCGKKHKRWQMHHIIPKSEGGTNRPKNFALLGIKCHDKVHKQGLQYKLNKNKQYKESTFMSIIRMRFYKFGYKIVYGYQTFIARNQLGLSKSHENDAFVIAGGAYQNRVNPYIVTQKRKNNRCLQLNRKGLKPSIRKQRYTIQPKDLVKIKDRLYEVKGVHSYGTQIKLLDKIGKIINRPIIKLDNWVFHSRTLAWS